MICKKAGVVLERFAKRDEEDFAFERFREASRVKTE